MLSKDQSKEILLEIDHRLSIYFLNVSRFGKEGSHRLGSMEVLIKMVIEPAGLSIESFKNLTPMQKLEKTIQCCKMVGFDEFNTKCMLGVWSDHAYKLMNQTKAS